MGSVRPSFAELPPIDLNKTLLPTSLKILVGFSLNNDFKNVYIINSPKYITPNKETIQVGDILLLNHCPAWLWTPTSQEKKHNAYN